MARNRQNALATLHYNTFVASNEATCIAGTILHFISPLSMAQVALASSLIGYNKGLISGLGYQRYRVSFFQAEEDFVNARDAAAVGTALTVAAFAFLQYMFDIHPAIGMLFAGAFVRMFSYLLAHITEPCEEPVYQMRLN